MEARVREWLERPYAVRLTPLTAEDGGGCIASVPQLGRGTVTGYGETAGGALDSLRESLREYFEQLASRGEQPPPVESEPTFPEELPSGQVALRLPRELHGRLRAAAAESAVSINTYLVYLLSHNLASDLARTGAVEDQCTGQPVGADPDDGPTPAAPTNGPLLALVASDDGGYGLAA